MNVLPSIQRFVSRRLFRPVFYRCVDCGVEIDSRMADLMASQSSDAQPRCPECLREHLGPPTPMLRDWDNQ